MAILTINNLTYQYPSSPQPALKDISLTLESGEFLAVIGANGAGKSSLCYTAAGFIPHFFRGELNGQVLIDGVDSSQSNLNELVLHAGLVFQNPFNQISGSKFTVYEEIAFGLENLGIAREEMKARIDEALALTNIADLGKRSPYALSGGQQQRVALASILVMQPKLLVLDEPTSQLDPIGTQEVFQVIRAMTKRGMTILMAEHKIEQVAEFADRVIALDAGEILLEGTPGEVLTSPLLPERGVGISRYTQVARRAQAMGLWSKQTHLPATLAQAVRGFGGADAAQEVNDAA
ncbi:MAG: ABC transporter ATP-binding protein [Anaerolineae bacterium]|nr:ABC transporter ATP-binding protein [Anaerolineae bacterium]